MYCLCYSGYWVAAAAAASSYYFFLFIPPFVSLVTAELIFEIVGICELEFCFLFWISSFLGVIEYSFQFLQYQKKDVNFFNQWLEDSITNMLKVTVKTFTAMALLKEFTNGHEARWCKWLPGV